ncbi:hypothetical protein A5740_25770 [Mycobacterium sp. GA-1841]|nr:hypothetical protein A5740_25770 [Mycobacterium sp. GA-1841]
MNHRLLRSMDASMVADASDESAFIRRRRLQKKLRDMPNQIHIATDDHEYPISTFRLLTVRKQRQATMADA